MNNFYISKNTLLKVLLWAFMTQYCSAQLLEINPDDFNYPVGNGLEENGYHMFIQSTDDGYTWISSVTNGVYRYNGLSYERFPQEDQVSMNVQSNLLKSPEGDMWFSSLNAIHQYQYLSNDLKSYPLSLGPDSSPLSGLTPFYLDAANEKLWLKAGNLLGTLDINDMTAPIQLISSETTEGVFFTYGLSDNEKLSHIYGYWMRGFEIWTKKNAQEWEKKRIYYTDPTTKDTLPNITKIIVGNKGIIWLLSSNGIIEYHLNDPLQSRYLAKGFYCNGGTLIDSNYLLIATARHDILQYDLAADTFLKGPSPSIPDDYINLLDIHQDHEGTLWVGQREKGFRYSKKQKQSFSNPFDQLKISPKVQSILRDDQNNMWIGTESKGIYVFSINGKLKEHYSYDKELELIGLQQLSKDKDGRIWALNRSNIFTFEADKWQRIFKHKDQQMFSVFHHSSGNHLLSTLTNLYQLHLEADTSRISNLSKCPDELKLNTTYLYETASGQILFPLVNIGLQRFEFKNNQLEYVDSLSLATDFFSCSQSPIGNQLWLGSRKGLLNVDLGKQLSSTYLHPSNLELGNKDIYASIPDNTGGLWITSNNMLYYSDVNDSLYNYQIEDGLVSNNFIKQAATKAADGRIWLGTDKGLVVFHPTDIQHFQSPPQIHLEELWINNEKQENAVYDGIYIDKRHRLELDHRVQSIRIKAVAVSAQQAEKSRIQYKRAEKKEEWTEIKNGELIRFENQSPGRFDLLIRGIDSNGVKSEIRQLHLNIKTPIWQKVWFWLLNAALVIGGIYLALRARLERKLKNQQRIFDERNRIASDLHDDIGSTLSNIHILATLGRQKMNADDQVYAILGRIEEEAFSSAESLDDIIWNINVQNDPLDRVFARMRRYASEMFEANDIEGVIQFSKEIPTLHLDMVKRRHLYLFFKEAINNLSKYANCNTARIEIKYLKKRLYLTISDDGIGFDIEKVEKGNGLKTMADRIEKLGGEFNIASQAGKGTTITVNIPITEKSD